MQDLRFALRQIWMYPGFSAVAVLTLALGIGANTAIFSVIYGVLLKPLPYPEPERLVTLWERSPERGIEQEILAGRPVILMLRVLDAPGERHDYHHYVVVDGFDPRQRLLRFHFGDGKTRWSPLGSIIADHEPMATTPVEPGDAAKVPRRA